MQCASIRAAVSVLAALSYSACATPGPVEPVAPCVEVRHFESTLITPEAIQFVGRVVIVNQMNGPLEIEKVDYGAELHDQPIVSSTFAELQAMRSHSTQTV